MGKYVAELKKERVEFGNKPKYMLALGFFDCIHVGHRSLLGNLSAVATLYNLTPAVFTFDDDFFKAGFLHFNVPHH